MKISLFSYGTMMKSVMTAAWVFNSSISFTVAIFLSSNIHDNNASIQNALKSYGLSIIVPFPNEETYMGIGGISYDPNTDIWTSSAENIPGTSIDDKYPLASKPRIYSIKLDFLSGTFEFTDDPLSGKAHVLVSPEEGLKIEDLEMNHKQGIDGVPFFWLASETNSDIVSTSKYLSKNWGTPDLSTYDPKTFSNSRLVLANGKTGAISQETQLPSFAQWNQEYSWDANQCKGDRPFQGLHGVSITDTSMFVGFQAALYQDGYAPTDFKGSATRILVFDLPTSSDPNNRTAQFSHSYRYDTSRLSIQHYQRSASHFNALFSILALSETSMLVVECEDFNGFGKREIINRIFYTKFNVNATIDHCFSLLDCDVKAQPKYLVWEEKGSFQLDGIGWGPMVEDDAGNELPTIALVFEDDDNIGARFELFLFNQTILESAAQPYENTGPNTNELLRDRYVAIISSFVGVALLFALQLWLVKRDHLNSKPKNIFQDQDKDETYHKINATSHLSVEENRSEIISPSHQKDDSQLDESTNWTFTFSHYLLITSMMNSFLVGGLTFGWGGLALMLRKEGTFASQCSCGSFCSTEKESLAIISTAGFAITIGSRILLGILLDTKGPKITVTTSGLISLTGILILGFADNLSRAALPGWILLSLGGSGMHISGFHATSLFKGDAKKVASAGISVCFGASSAIFPILQVFNQFSNVGLQSLCAGYSCIVGLVLLNSFLVAPWARVQPGIRPSRDLRFWRMAWWTGDVRKKPFLVSVFDEVKKFEFWGEALFYSVNLFLLTHYLSTTGQLMFEKGDIKFTTNPNSWSDYTFARLAGWFNSLGFLWFPIVSLIVRRYKWPSCYSITWLANILVVAIVLVPSLETQVIGSILLSFSRLLLFSFHHAYLMEKFGMEYFGTLNGISSLIAALFGLLSYPLQLVALGIGFSISFIPIGITIFFSALFPILLRKRPLLNWAESYSVDPLKFRFPDTIEQLKHIIKTEKQIRCAGAMHSCAPLIESDGVIISLEKFNRILEIDVKNRTATVQAGVVIHELCEALEQYGLALGTLGTIDWQTVVGAVMTGTHGGSLVTPSLHEFALSYTLITANGETIIADRHFQPDLFSAIAPSMGVFGVVTEMKLRLVPLQHLAAKMISMPFSELISSFKDLMRENIYCRVVIYPTIDTATVWTAEPVKPGDAVAKGATKATGYINFRDEREKLLLQQYLWYSKKGQQKKADSFLRKVLDSQLKRLAYYEGQYNHVLCKERNNGIPHADMEFGFDFDKCNEVLERVKGYCEKNIIPYYNFEVRATKQDGAMLSCCYGRDTMWIDFQAKADVSGSYFGQMEDLLKPIGYRKHWAKGMDHTDPIYIVRQFPKIPNFLKLIEEFDPEGKFRNEHTNLWFDKTRESCHQINCELLSRSKHQCLEISESSDKISDKNV